jgi:hypothetical protein
MQDKHACPNCGELHEIKEAHSQATRHEPSAFLGEYILCFKGTGNMGAKRYHAETKDKRFRHRRMLV